MGGADQGERRDSGLIRHEGSATRNQETQLITDADLW